MNRPFNLNKHSSEREYHTNLVRDREITRSSNTQGRDSYFDGNRSNINERRNEVKTQFFWSSSNNNYRGDPRNDRQVEGSTNSSSWNDRNHRIARIPRREEERNYGNSDRQIPGGSSNRRFEPTMSNWRDPGNRNPEGSYHNWGDTRSTRTYIRSRSPDIVPQRRSDRRSREFSPDHDWDKRNERIRSSRLSKE